MRLTQAGVGVRCRTGCLADRLLQRSGMPPEELRTLNQQVQKLRDALARATSDEAATKP